MNNLDLQNKLLALAKVLAEHKKAYPAAEHDLEQLIQDLHPSEAEVLDHLTARLPYRKSLTSA